MEVSDSDWLNRLLCDFTPIDTTKGALNVIILPIQFFCLFYFDISLTGEWVMLSKCLYRKYKKIMVNKMLAIDSWRYKQSVKNSTKTGQIKFTFEIPGYFVCVNVHIWFLKFKLNKWDSSEKELVAV